MPWKRRPKVVRSTWCFFAAAEMFGWIDSYKSESAEAFRPSLVDSGMFEVIEVIAKLRENGWASHGTGRVAGTTSSPARLSLGSLSC